MLVSAAVGHDADGSCWHTPADGVVVEPAWVVCCMLLQGQLPELAADLVSALANLDGDELTRHQEQAAARAMAI